VYTRKIKIKLILKFSIFLIIIIILTGWFSFLISFQIAGE
jgi:hypothetical protein